MLSKSSRLNRELFLAIFKKSRRLSGVGFQVLYTPAPTFRASVVVSKKVASLATKRNYIRRRIYTTLRTLGASRALTGYYIVLVTPESKKHSFSDLLSSIQESIEKILSDNRYSR